MRRHISKSIARRSAALRTALEKYNELAPIQDPPRPIITYKEIVGYASLGEFDLLRYSRNDILSKPWSRSVNREMCTKYFKVIGARQEIDHLNVEVRRLQDWVDEEDELFQHTSSSLVDADPLLAAELQTLGEAKSRVNDVHRARIQEIYKLPGYTGPINSLRGSYHSRPQNDNDIPMLDCNVNLGNLEHSDVILPDEDDEVNAEVTALEDVLSSFVL
jgi:hypothetical protein